MTGQSKPPSPLFGDAHTPRLNSRGRWVYGCPDTWLTWGFPTEEACREFSEIHVEWFHGAAQNAQAYSEAEGLHLNPSLDMP